MFSATEAPTPAVGPATVPGSACAVDLASAVVLASVRAKDGRVSRLEPTVTPPGSVALEVVLARLTAIAAAASIAPPEVLAGGAAGSEPEPETLLFEATLLPKVRW